MKDINTPNGFVCTGLKSVYPEMAGIDPKTLLTGLPLYDTLHFVIERQKKVMYCYGNQEEEINLVYEMYQYLGDDAKQRLAFQIADNPRQCLFFCTATFQFIMLAIQVCEQDSRKLTNDEILKVYQAYMYCNDYWSDKQADGIHPLAMDKNLPGMYLMADVPIVEFKNFKDFKPQLYKAWRLFEFMSSHNPYNDYLNMFLNRQGVSSWQEYLSSIFSFYTQIINKPIVKIEEEYKTHRYFFDALCVKLQDCKTIWDDHDMKYLRNHPLIKISDCYYMVLNDNLLVDRIYQCLKFQIFEAMLDKKACNAKGKVYSKDDYGNFSGNLGEDFSESEIFYHIIEKAFDGIADRLIRGNDMKKEKVPAEPDYYMRIGDKVFLFEYKDNTISDDDKQSTDYNYVKEVILSRICKDDGRTRKGAGQLLNSMNEMVNKNSLDNFDDEAKNAKIIYPIVVTTDRTFSALGIQYHMVERFSKIIENWNIPTFVRIPMVLDLDTLVLMSKRIHDRQISFVDVVEQYLNLNDLHLASFETFYTDYYRELKDMTPDDIAFLYGDMLAAM